MKTPQKIILLAHHGLGDLLMTVPLIRSLESTLAGDEELEILVKAPYVGRVLDALPPGPRTRITALDRSRTGLVTQLARLRAARPRLVLAPHSTTGIGAALVVRAMGAEHAIGPAGPYAWLGFTDTVESPPGAHKVDVYYSYARAAGRADTSRPSLALDVEYASVSEATAALHGFDPNGDVIAIAPGSGLVEQHKRWPAPQWKALAEQLLKRADTRLLLIGTPDERALLDSIRPDGVPSDRVATLAHADPLVAHAALARADVALTACAGASHLAASAGLPIVGLFGPTNPGFTGPAGVPLHVLRAGLSCSPCYRSSLMSGCGDAVCMRSIAVESVVEATVACLRGTAPSVVPWCPTTGAVEPAAAPRTDRAIAGGVG